jgi:hypothetical protein
MKLISRGAYRAWQVWRALKAGPLPAGARHEVAELLGPQLMVLFDSQSYAGRQHGYRVMKTLAEAGHDDHPLLAAALLHDVGKAGRRYTWLDRAKVVLVQRLAPSLADRWSLGAQTGWTRAFVVKARHPEWGAQAVAASGASALSVALVRRHQETQVASGGKSEENRLLLLLQWADDQN